MGNRQGGDRAVESEYLQEKPPIPNYSFYIPEGKVWFCPLGFLRQRDRFFYFLLAFDRYFEDTLNFRVWCLAMCR
ncbi:MAG: hypothetical protein AAGA60_28700 [Cyanobacteria bacterium P01_E01_bin.42]